MTKISPNMIQCGKYYVLYDADRVIGCVRRRRGMWEWESRPSGCWKRVPTRRMGLELLLAEAWAEKKRNAT